VKTESLDTAQPKPTSTEGTDFFNVKQFPTISSEQGGEEGRENAYQVSGDMTLHGVTRSGDVKVERTGRQDPLGRLPERLREHVHREAERLRHEGMLDAIATTCSSP